MMKVGEVRGLIKGVEGCEEVQLGKEEDGGWWVGQKMGGVVGCEK